MAPLVLSNGLMPALAAPTGAAEPPEGVELSPESDGVLAEELPPEDAAGVPEEPAAGELERQEASELGPTVIVLLQASLSSESKSDNCTWVPAAIADVQEISVVLKSPTVTRASPQGSEALTTIRL